ncbi:benenodin family lasso peptide [Brevundimonas diminuta]|uniref:benenodin family lasso peptide n=1 Tax=Brevundimonas diminuta TaxID=293 RepID=UPI0037C863F6
MEDVMERTEDHRDNDLIDLGSVIDETKGGGNQTQLDARFQPRDQAGLDVPLRISSTRS